MDLGNAWSPVSMASVRASEWTFIMDTDDTFPPHHHSICLACLVSRTCSF